MTGRLNMGMEQMIKMTADTRHQDREDISKSNGNLHHYEATEAIIRTKKCCNTISFP
jgi:hypothetical protein